MTSKKNVWDEVRKQLEENFKDDLPARTEVKLQMLKSFKFSDDSDDSEFELFLPKYRDIVLGVGIHITGKNEGISYFPTEAMVELKKVLGSIPL